MTRRAQVTLMSTRAVQEQRAKVATVRSLPRHADGAFLPEPSDEFVLTASLERVCRRAESYLQHGYPVHLAGTSGIGKTTLAFHLAAMRGRPAIMLHGNHEFGASDLVGSNSGYRREKVVDNYIHTVLKTKEEFKQIWVDNRLAKACREGFTLIYDEFNRSKPDANNVLLSVLEEGILSVPDRNGKGFIRVHPDFRAIFTSNPSEYAGTHASADALLDRMITVRLGLPERQTEARIVATRADVELEMAAKIVDLVRCVRDLDPKKSRPSVRAGIAMAKILAERSMPLSFEDVFTRDVCRDILLSGAGAWASEEAERIDARATEFMQEHWG